MKPREHDELVVRLLALAEGGGLQSLTMLEFDSNLPAGELQILATLGFQNWQSGLTQGPMLLLLLWLKRQAKKALQADGEGVLWDVQGLRLNHMNPSMMQIADTALAQMKDARSQIRKARGGAGGVRD